jgi:hypothetical protein
MDLKPWGGRDLCEEETDLSCCWRKKTMPRKKVQFSFGIWVFLWFIVRLLGPMNVGPLFGPRAL